MQEYYSQFNRDPNDVRLVPPGKPVRLWPYVLAGLLMALLLWAYSDPIPEHTTSTTVTIGPNSPLYGPSPSHGYTMAGPGLIGPPYPTERPPHGPGQRWCDEYTIPACVWPKVTR